MDLAKSFACLIESHHPNENLVGWSKFPCFDQPARAVGHAQHAKEENEGRNEADRDHHSPIEIIVRDKCIHRDPYNERYQNPDNDGKLIHEKDASPTLGRGNFGHVHGGDDGRVTNCKAHEEASNHKHEETWR